VERGVLLAVVVAVIERARHQYHPDEEILVSGTAVSDRARARLAGTPPEALVGVVAYRFGASLFFANAERFDQSVRRLVEEADPPVHLVVIDAGAMTDIDVTGAQVLQTLAEDLRRRGVVVVLTDLSRPAAATLERAGVIPTAAGTAKHLEQALHDASPPSASPENPSDV
jgi:MFS superfamily sulfate permease-like transporter